MKASAFVLFLIVWGSLASPIQDPSAQNYTMRVKVDLVTVDVVVRHHNGNILGGFQAEDFAVYDNRVVQQISHFSRDMLPLAVAIVVDRSPSVARNFGELRSAAKLALSRLKPQDQVVLFSFDQFTSRRCDLTQDHARIASLIGMLTIGNCTDIGTAVFEAAKYLHDNAADRRRAIILVSDNVPNTFMKTEESVVRELLESGAIFYSIELPYDATRPVDPDTAMPCQEYPDINNGQVRRMVSETGGEVLPSGSGMISKSLDSIFSDLSLRYTLGFTPSAAVKEGDYHALLVKLKSGKPCGGCRVQFRKGYYAGAHQNVSGIQSTVVPPKLHLPGRPPTMPSTAALPSGSSLFELNNPIVDLSFEQIRRSYPELADLRFEDSPDELARILAQLGSNAVAFFRDFSDTASREEVYQERLAWDGSVEDNMIQQFNYLMLPRGDGSASGYREERMDVQGRPLVRNRIRTGFSFLTSGYAAAHLFFLPRNQGDFRYRHLGQKSAGAPVVIVFSQKPESRLTGSLALGNDTAELLYNGILWLDPQSYQILRIRTDLFALQALHPLSLSLQTDVQLSPVRFPTVAQEFWLPREVVVSIVWERKRYRNIHRYSNYRRFSVESHEKRGAPIATKPPLE